jgi:CDR ABC transporter
VYTFTCSRQFTNGNLLAVGGYPINCATKEFATLEPPSGSTCISYLQSYISRHGGYLANPDATSGCSFCSARTTDEWFGPAFNMSYSHHWRDLGIFVAYIIFNVSFLFLPNVHQPESNIGGFGVLPYLSFPCQLSFKHHHWTLQSFCGSTR